MKLRSILTTIAISLGSLVGSAHAQQVQPVQVAYYDDNHERREYDHGYRDGSHSGHDDARHGRGFILYDHPAYRDHHDREYREGFERGYRDTYRASSGYVRDRDDNHYRDDYHDRNWDRDQH